MFIKRILTTSDGEYGVFLTLAKLLWTVLALIALTVIITLVVQYNNQDAKEDRVKEVDKDGAVDTHIAITHLTDTLDVITTRHIVWKDKVQVGDFVKQDTIPSLGLTNTVGENDEGMSKTVYLAKEYELYISVK